MRIQTSWEKEIEKDMNDKKQSVIWALENGVIEKSGEPDIIMKSGEDIKSKLMGDKSEITIELSESESKLSSLFKSLGVDPEKELSNGVNLYSFTQIEKSEELGNEMRKYNNLAIKNSAQGKKLNYLNTLIEGVQGDKEYKLNSRIATELGF